MTIGELFDKINSWPEDTMNFRIIDVFSWRGVYAEAAADVAANEVEDVINSALTSEELSKICNASKAVKDADVSDDPTKLTYGQDCYSDNGSYVRTDGSIDSNIVGKHESFYFGAPIY